MVADGDATRGLDNGLAMVVTTLLVEALLQRKTNRRAEDTSNKRTLPKRRLWRWFAWLGFPLCAALARERERERERERKTDRQRQKKSKRTDRKMCLSLFSFTISIHRARQFVDAVDEDVLCRARRVCQVTYVLSRGVFCRRRVLSLSLSLSLSRR